MGDRDNVHEECGAVHPPPHTMLLPTTLPKRTTWVHHFVCLTSPGSSYATGWMTKQGQRTGGGVGLAAWLRLFSPHSR